MKKSLTFLLVLFLSATAFSQDKLAQDRSAIKALAGFYEVTFNYSETFSPNSNYKFFPKQESHGSEWVLVIEDSPNKIVLQHILVLGKDFAMKHWREDWIYEAPERLVFQENGVWKMEKNDPALVKGTWTQNVYQVDDSPRYGNIGTWQHTDGRHQWQGFADSPLPRREHTIRNDYNVLKRTNRVYLTPNGWMFEQDNSKVMRAGGKETLIAQEKGLEEFTKIDPAIFDNAKSWWSGQQTFWVDVVNLWNSELQKPKALRLKEKVDGKALYEIMFPLAEKSVAEKWSREKNKAETLTVFKKFISE